MGQVPVYDQSISYVIMMWVMVLEINALIFMDEII